MPSKIQLDENLWFLYICLQKSDLKTINFAAVGATTNLKPPAARMRYTRLRRQIESGTLIGTHGTPFAGSSAVEKIAEAGKKRKRTSTPAVSAPVPTHSTVPTLLSPNTEEAMRVQPKEEYRPETKITEPVVKQESEYESSDEDSEDEVPLAKLRKVMMEQTSGNGVGPGQMSRPFGEPVAFNPAFLGSGRMAWGGPGQVQVQGQVQWIEDTGAGYCAGGKLGGTS